MFAMLMQLSMTATLTWIHSKDVEILAPPVSQEVKVKPKQTLLNISRLNNRSAPTVEKEETMEVRSEDVLTNNKYFYETKYPELIASMIQTKVVGLSRKEGFNFIEYYNSRSK